MKLFFFAQNDTCKFLHDRSQELLDSAVDYNRRTLLFVLSLVDFDLIVKTSEKINKA